MHDQWSRMGGITLSERSRAIPSAIPNMTAAGRLTNQWIIWSWPLVKLKSERNIRAYRAPEMKAGQETNHGPPLFWIGSRQARSPRIRPRKRISTVTGRIRREEAVSSFGLCSPWWLPEIQIPPAAAPINAAGSTISQSSPAGDRQP